MEISTLIRTISEHWDQFWAVTTILIAMVGTVLCRIRYLKFKAQAPSEVNLRFKRICYSVGLFCAVTVPFGFFNFIGVNLDFLLYPVRALVIGFVIWALWKLSADIEENKNV